MQIDNHLLFTSNPIILFAYPTPPTIASKYGEFYSPRLHDQSQYYFCLIYISRAQAFH